MLPQGWAEATVEELAGAAGYVSDGDWIESKDQDPLGEVRLIQLADIGVGRFISKSARFLTKETALRLKCSKLKQGDVLIARMPDPIGRACIFPGLDQDAITVVDVLLWRSDSTLALPAWFEKWLNSPDVQELMKSEATGTTRQRVAGGRIKNMRVFFPPLAEQRRIVAKLDSLTVRIARARAELERARKNAEHIRIATLGKAFHWNETDLPRGWTRKKIGEIGDVQLGRQRSPKDHVGPHMRPYVRSANITWDGWDLSDVKEMNFSPAEFETFKLQPGDVLLNEGSGSPSEVGKPAIWNDEIKNACFQNTVLRVRSDAFSPELLRYVLLFLARTGAFIKNTQGVNIIHIGKAGLSRTYIPVPPISEQPKILKEIQAGFDAANRLQHEADRSLTLINRLESSFLAKAFRGELVPQDPTDEPASVLLDRIRAERAADTKPGRKRRA